MFILKPSSSRKSIKIHGRTVHLDAGIMALPYHCSGNLEISFLRPGCQMLFMHASTCKTVFFQSRNHID